MFKKIKRGVSKLSPAEWGAIVIVIAFFILSSLLSTKYSADIQEMLQIPLALAMIFYVLLMILSVVVAPVTTLPLLPLAAKLWGSLPAAILTIVGWALGSVIAFLLARRFGKPVVRKFVDLKKIEKMENLIPEERLFWTIVLFRLVFPVEIVSYGLGLFSSISLPLYIATLIGIIPFGVVFAYVANIPVEYQIGAGVAALILIAAIAALTYPRLKKKL